MTAAPLGTRVRTLLPSGGWRRALAYAPLAVPVVVLAALGTALAWMADDGWINVRILQQTFAGHGFLTYNPGERVEAGTSTLWLLLLAALHVLLPWLELGVLAAGAGVALMTAAMVLATLAGVRMARWRQPGAVGFLPFGTAVVAALPPFWDFTTSGLETALTFCWLALCQFLLVRRVDTARGAISAQRGAAPPAWRPLGLPVVIGLGFLVRPDAALYAAAFGIALLVASRRSILGWLATAVLAVILPACYELFRMGYFASLVPNTAVAKEAGETRLEEGWYYLLDFVVPYSAWFPVVVTLAVLAGPVLSWLRRRDWAPLVTTLAPVPAALLHAAYVVRLGGDFMHARFLLPAMFALMLPVAVLEVRRRDQLGSAVGALVLGWCIAVGSGARVAYTANPDVMTGDYAGTPPRVGVANEREFWTHRTLSHRTVRIADWRGSGPATDGEAAAQDAALGRAYYRDPYLLPYVLDRATPQERPRLQQEIKRRRNTVTARPAGLLWDVPPGSRLHLTVDNAGIIAVLAGPDVVVVDRMSLADAITARARPMSPQPSRAGHRRANPAWQAARYAAPGRLQSQRLKDAAAALKCGDLPVLIEATTAPMTRERFWANVALAPRLTAFTFPEDPSRAREALCGWAPPLADAG